MREASFQALAAIRRCIGDKAAASLMEEVEKVKLAKVREMGEREMREKIEREFVLVVEMTMFIERNCL